MITFYDAIPDGPNNPSADQPLMLLNNIANVAALGINHRTFNQLGTGQHKAIQFDQTTSYVPVPPVSPPQLFTDVVAGFPQLKYYTGDAAHSSNQYTPIGPNFSTMLFAGMIVKGGSFITSLATNPVTYVGLALNDFPNNTLAVILTPKNAAAAAQNVFVLSANAQGFVTQTSTATGLEFYFIAIGY